MASLKTISADARIEAFYAQVVVAMQPGGLSPQEYAAVFGRVMGYSTAYQQKGGKLLPHEGPIAVEALVFVFGQNIEAAYSDIMSGRQQPGGTH